MLATCVGGWVGGWGVRAALVVQLPTAILISSVHLSIGSHV